jgi:hypothetical protein
MSVKFAGTKVASITAGVLFILVVVGIAFLVGGDALLWAIKGAPAKFSRYSETTFPLLWEYKVHVLTAVVLVAVIYFVRGMHDGPVKKY